MKDYIDIRWHIDDVLSLDDTLTQDQAREVLQAVKFNHDATMGVNWEVIQFWINNVKEK